MRNTHIFQFPFASIYPCYLTKAERKGRPKAEVDAVIGWLTGYDASSLQKQIDSGVDLANFFASAPRIHPNAHKITGLICGHRIEEIEDPLMKKIRQLDKLVDELAKGRPLAKILRP
jgi:hypothetical protein